LESIDGPECWLRAHFGKVIHDGPCDLAGCRPMFKIYAHIH
jgi:hypothetical protein